MAAPHDGQRLALVRELTEELELAEDPPWLTLTADPLRLPRLRRRSLARRTSQCRVDEHDEIRWVTAAEVADLDLAHPSYVQF